MMPRRLPAALALAVLALGAARASAQLVPVADYQDDFQTPAPSPGWSYSWNPGGRLGDRLAYQPLDFRNGRYESSVLTDGTFVAVGRGPEDPVAFPPGSPFGPYPETYARPGVGTLQENANGIERAAIVGYVIQPEDLAAVGVGRFDQVNLFITDYDFAVATTSTDGMSARVYRNAEATPIINFSNDSVPPFPFPPGFRFETALDPRPIPLGAFGVGDAIYVALGANGTNVGDEIRLDFTLSAAPVPEPAAMTALAPLGGMLLLRRRGR